MQETALLLPLVCCLDVAQQETLLSGIFFALKKWIIVELLRRGGAGKILWKGKGRIASEHHKDPRHLLACHLGQPNVSWAWGGLAVAKWDEFSCITQSLRRSKRNGAGMSVCYLL